jgi:hypothetical protein
LARSHAPAQSSKRGAAPPPLDTANIQEIKRVFLTTRDFEDEENAPEDTITKDTATVKPSKENPTPTPAPTDSGGLKWWLGAAAAAGYYWNKNKGNTK